MVSTCILTRKEGSALFNNALDTFYLRLYGIEHMVKDNSDRVRVETHCHNYTGYSFQLAARFFLYVPPHTQNSTSVEKHWLEWEWPGKIKRK